MKLNKITFKKINPDNINIVLYHSGCFDGFACAFIVWYYYKQKFGIDIANNISYIPCVHQNEVSEEFINKIKDKNVLMCDFSYNYDLLIKLIDVSESFMILDHHKTAEANLKNISCSLKIFDMKKSGCGITWDFFFPNSDMPAFLKHIQDRDIWSYAVPNTLEFITYFYQKNFDFELWESYIDNTLVKKAVKIGGTWLNYQKKIIEETINSCASTIVHEIDNKHVTVAYCNVPYFKSDIGNKLFDKFPNADFSCVWDFDLYRDQTLFSLRSTNERMDVSTIAKKIGGGGHRNASGIAVPKINGNLPFPIIRKIKENNVDINQIYKPIKIKGNIIEYHELIICDIVARTTYLLHKIDNKYVIGLYCNSSICKYDVAIEMLKKFSFGDFACVWNYDIHKNESDYLIVEIDKDIDISKKLKNDYPDRIINEHFNNINQNDYDVILFNGICGCLPFEKVDDLGLMQLFLNANTNFFMDDKNTYTLFKIKEFKKEWLEKFMDIIKTKYIDSMLIVFERNISSNSSNLTKEFTVFYNEKNVTDPENQLMMEVIIPKDQALVFCSQNNFWEVFQNISSKNYDNNSDDYTDSNDSYSSDNSEDGELLGDLITSNNK